MRRRRRRRRTRRTRRRVMTTTLVSETTMTTAMTKTEPLTTILHGVRDILHEVPTLFAAMLPWAVGGGRITASAANGLAQVWRALTTAKAAAKAGASAAAAIGKGNVAVDRMCPSHLLLPAVHKSVVAATAATRVILVDGCLKAIGLAGALLCLQRSPLRPLQRRSIRRPVLASTSMAAFLGFTQRQSLAARRFLYVLMQAILTRMRFPRLRWVGRSLISEQWQSPQGRA
jgi:hypothetical protein